MSDHALTPVNADIQDGIEQDNYDYVEKYVALSGLPKFKAKILQAEMANYMSDSPPLTAAQIAENVGCHVNTVFQAHKDSRYLACKDKIQDMWFQGQAGSVYAAVLQTARDGKVGAQKLALEVMGKHVTRIESKSVHIDASMADTGALDLDAAIDRFLIMIGNRGWSLEMLADRWRELKASQAF